jgi:choline dehydrogenase-like flavoprotein
MEHPHFVVGSAILRTDISFHKRSERVSFAPTKAAISSLGIKNCRLSLDSYYHEDKARQLIANIACVVPELATALFSMLGKHLVCVGPVYASWEQEPKFENRIELSGEIDKLGVPRPILRWKKSVDERKTVSNVTRLFGEYIAATDIGRVHLSPWFADEGPYPENDELAGCHHMGGTRMSDNAEEGIVDRNCKVFGLDNIYIAGSSVFPSVGYGNPTLTIVQLALRLADHLRSLNRKSLSLRCRSTSGSPFADWLAAASTPSEQGVAL